MRSFTGCWTCRLRRKKCDESRPFCKTCTTLNITCHYESEKPEWMDGGIRQKEKAKQLKRNIKAHRRRECSGSQEDEVHNTPTSVPSLPQPSPITPTQSHLPVTWSNEALVLYAAGDDAMDNVAELPDSHNEWPDALLFTFYFEHVLPYMFPFYRPPARLGGRSWILDMLMTSAVVRKTALCQSTYLFSLALGTVDCDVAWNKVLTQTQEAFQMLRRSLQGVHELGVARNPREAVKVLASVMQVQRFDITVNNLESTHAHHSAAIALTLQLLENPTSGGTDSPVLRYKNVMKSLGPSAWTLPSHSVQVPSADEANLDFSISLNIFHDTIASTILRQKPELSDYHLLLQPSNEGNPLIDLAAIVGIQNWIILAIGQIAALEAWKQRCKSAGALDVMDLVRRASPIKEELLTQLVGVEADSVRGQEHRRNSMDSCVLAVDQILWGRTAECSTIATRIWAHASLLYLSVVVSGRQPASQDVRKHVSSLVDLFATKLQPPALLRTCAWAFFVLCCFADPHEQMVMRGLVEQLRPPSMFGTLYKIVRVMEGMADLPTSSTDDLFTCLRSQEQLVLPV